MKCECDEQKHMQTKKSKMQYKSTKSWRDSARQPITSEPHLAATLGKIEHLDGVS